MDSTIVTSDSSADDSSVLIVEQTQNKNTKQFLLDGTITISSESEDEGGKVSPEIINISSESESEEDQGLQHAPLDTSDDLETTINEKNLGTMIGLQKVEDAFAPLNSTLDESRTLSELHSSSYIESSLNSESQTSANSTFEESSSNLFLSNQSSLILSGSSYLVESECTDLSNSLSLSNDSSTVIQDQTYSSEATSEDDTEMEEVKHMCKSQSRSVAVSEKELPRTCTVLTSNKTGGTLYLVGTAHFSKESQADVARVIQKTQPDVLVLELCNARVNILHLNEEDLLMEAQNLTLEKVLTTIRQSGVVQGTMYLFLLHFSEKLTKELGMAPGGEFRRAFQEAQKVPGCVVQLGDRPINITLKRAFSSLSFWQKLKFGFSILTCKDTITAEEVEKCKQKDLLESMLLDIAGEYPELSRVFVNERDLFLANTLRQAVDARICFSKGEESSADGPPVVVGVVGIGHVAGIVENWDKTNPQDLAKLMHIPTKSLMEKATLSALRLSLLCLSGYALYKVVGLPVGLIKEKLHL